MKLTIYQIDAFTDHVFGGNPAAVCFLEKWLDDDLMQRIAMENNLAETAFLVKTENGFEIRWFTPTVEVDLCGHATLASAHVLYSHLGYSESLIRFLSPRSGLLTVEKVADQLSMDFPTDELTPMELPTNAIEVFGTKPIEAYQGKTDYLFVFADEETVQSCEPRLDILVEYKCRGVIITAPGNEVDFVSRFFAPQSGIPEDPVTGSAHTSLTPYWSKRLNKERLTAKQLSARSGDLILEYHGERVNIIGKAVTYMVGEIEI